MDGRQYMFRILRGRLSRREGSEVRTKDAEGNLTQVKRAPVVHYGPGMELLMTYAQAKAFGIEKVSLVLRKDNGSPTDEIPKEVAERAIDPETETETTTPSNDPTPPPPPGSFQTGVPEVSQNVDDVDPVDQSKLRMLIAEGKIAANPSQVSSWKANVRRSGFLVNLPQNTGQIISALQALIEEPESSKAPSEGDGDGDHNSDS